MTARQMTNEQRAALYLLPLVQDKVKDLRAESIRADQEYRKASKGARSADARQDYAEMLGKAQGRLEGAQDVLRMLQAVAKGETAGPAPAGSNT